MKTGNNLNNLHVDQELDLRGEICPYPFIKSKLILEQMSEGEVLRVIVDYYPAVRNITKSMEIEGYHILNVDKLGEIDTAIYISKPRI
ncbi:MAG: hypothetical protein A2161_12430 [Candidatus Schekmanbacteria bacterium RBG_13_48_7]|uniref:UPF0033 domain-containing protein n=1 Tax=Candidatus Schekmanbacteria bacterium RBG_13_48_7 TaxID=1817878 RepID=A0A1F7RKH6_9BACT|nr:MAG: hypothetical protein A2161_12430 [Candidatus Schekmanbacteria bacterium RBG_13_48_7]